MSVGHSGDNAVLARCDVPGKLMLAGEYAVLAPGGHAIAAAVGRLASAAVVADDDGGRCELRAFGQRWRWHCGDPAPSGLAGFVAATVARLAAAGVALNGTLRVEVAQGEGGKHGLGSSAATCVAAGAALAAAAGWRDADAVVRLCDDSHREAQGGRGSGYDVFAVAAGGLSRYDRGARTSAPLRWPKGLTALALYAGVPADTRAALGGAVRPQAAELAAIADAEIALAATLIGDDAEAALAALAACERAFAALARRHVWLRPPEVEALAARIRAHGGQPRTSGAGGGDSTLAFFADATAAAALAAAHCAAGGVIVATLPADLAPAGLQWSPALEGSDA